MHFTPKTPNTTTAEFTNTVDPDVTAHNDLSHLDLQCLPSSLSFFNIIQFILTVFPNICRHNLLSAFWALYVLTCMYLQMTDMIEGQYLEEQVEAIKDLSDKITNLKRVGPGLGEWHFDKDLQS